MEKMLECITSISLSQCRRATSAGGALSGQSKMVKNPQAHLSNRFPPFSVVVAAADVVIAVDDSAFGDVALKMH